LNHTNQEQQYTMALEEGQFMKTSIFWGRKNFDCSICTNPFTEVLRKPITCPACDHEACQTCYKTFLTSEGVSRPKCMNCNTEWTKTFLRKHFTEAFIKGDLRQHASKILYQQQIAMLPATQPAVERRVLVERYKKELYDIDAQIKALKDRKAIMMADYRVLQNGGGLPESETGSAFQHKCCDPECRGFVSSAWKCGVCSKFSCAKCHEVKGKTTEEIEAHVCNPETVQTVQLLRADTKPCPGCGTYIHKTEGCDQMFCVSCKQLWSWKTGKIEQNGHNPHYLEWKRSRGDMARDPMDIQCGREIDWRLIHLLSSFFQRHASIPSTEASKCIQMCESLVHVRLHDMPNIRQKSQPQNELENLRIQYMIKEITDSHFQKRIYQIQQNAAVFQNILDLLVAMQNAATDIIYRMLDQFQNHSLNDQGFNTFMTELFALHSYGNQTIQNIYLDHGKTQICSFVRLHSFALFYHRY